MKRLYWILGGAILILIITIIFLLFRISSEDSWILDSQGMWVKHGNPGTIPEEVLAQQQLLACARDLYGRNSYENLSSQCLGSCDRYAVDIVHVPRAAEDNLEMNQCEAYVRGHLSHFIEMDKNGDIVRIV